MLWILMSAVLFLVAIGAGLALATSKNERGETLGMVGFAGGYGLVTVVWLVLSALFSIHIVDARNIGVVRSFGAITGQVGEGVKFTLPWQSVEEWNIRLQVIEPDTRCSNGTEKCMDAGSIDIQDVYIEGVLNIEVNPQDVQELARNVGQSYPDTIVRNRLYQVVKRVTATYRADQILESREQIRAAVREGMTTELAPYSISVTDFLLTNIDFTDEFRKSIDAKQKATQDALTAENVVRIKEAEARQASAVAQGAADARRIAAQAEADANNLINASLNDRILQLRLAQTLGDKVQLIPAGAGVIIDPTTLLGPR